MKVHSLKIHKWKLMDVLSNQIKHQIMFVWIFCQIQFTYFCKSTFQHHIVQMPNFQVCIPKLPTPHHQSNIATLPTQHDFINYMNKFQATHKIFFFWDVQCLNFLGPVKLLLKKLILP
jgi:hypothetical protein